MKKIIFTMMMISMIMIVGAVEQQLPQCTDYGVQPYNPVSIEQLCSNCTVINITYIKDPNSTIILGNTEMTQNDGYWNYTFTQNNKTGTYTVVGTGNPDGINEPWGCRYVVTPSGTANTTSGTLITIIAIITMITITIILFVIGTKHEGTTGKVIYYGTAIIITIITILFTTISLQQMIPGMPAIVQGYENFWFIIKMFISILVVAVILFSMYAAVRLWKYKRGLIE